MNLPDPDPTPPGIPARHIDAEQYHKLSEYAEDNA